MRLRGTKAERGAVTQSGAKIESGCSSESGNETESSLELESNTWWAEVGRVAPHVKRRMMERGSMLIGYQPFKDKTNFFR